MSCIHLHTLTNTYLREKRSSLASASISYHKITSLRTSYLKRSFKLGPAYRRFKCVVNLRWSHRRIEKCLSPSKFIVCSSQMDKAINIQPFKHILSFNSVRVVACLFVWDYLLYSASFLLYYIYEYIYFYLHMKKQLEFFNHFYVKTKENIIDIMYTCVYIDCLNNKKILTFKLNHVIET